MTIIRINGRLVTPEELQASIPAGRLEEMLEARQPPGSNTDREFMMASENGRQFQDTPSIGDAYRRIAEPHGQNVTGKKYLSSLARFPGDPEAWVSGKGDLERIVDERGWGCEGAVNRPVRNLQETPEVGVDPDLLDQEVAGIVESLPEGDRAGVDTQDLREQVYERRKPWWSKAPCPASTGAGTEER